MTPPTVYSVWQRHKGFVVAVSAGFALLHAELAWFARAVSLPPGGVAGTDWAWIAAVGTIALAGYLLSFAPATAFAAPGAERQGSLVLPELTAQLGRSAGIVVVAAAACLVLSLYLAGFDPTTAYSVWNNTYVITLAGTAYLHGVVAYVRYGALLYSVRQDSWAKVMIASGGIGVLLFGSFVYLHSLNLGWLGATAPALHGLVGLHVFVRDLFFFTLALGIWLWHGRWMANH